MTSEFIYLVAGVAIFFTGFAGALARSHLFWKVLGVNFMGSGVFLLLLAGAPGLPGRGADPVPQAMVLTGIVVAAAATALALGMALRVAVRSGRPWLSEDDPVLREASPPEGAVEEARKAPGEGSH